MVYVFRRVYCIPYNDPYGILLLMVLPPNKQNFMEQKSQTQCDYYNCFHESFNSFHIWHTIAFSILSYLCCPSSALWAVQVSPRGSVPIGFDRLYIIHQL
eukprot:433257_1